MREKASKQCVRVQIGAKEIRVARGRRCVARRRWGSLYVVEKSAMERLSLRLIAAVEAAASQTEAAGSAVRALRLRTRRTWRPATRAKSSPPAPGSRSVQINLTSITFHKFRTRTKFNVLMC